MHGMHSIPREGTHSERAAVTYSAARTVCIAYHVRVRTASSRLSHGFPLKALTCLALGLGCAPAACYCGGFPLKTLTSTALRLRRALAASDCGGFPLKARTSPALWLGRALEGVQPYKINAANVHYVQSYAVICSIRCAQPRAVICAKCSDLQLALYAAMCSHMGWIQPYGACTICCHEQS